MVFPRVVSSDLFYSCFILHPWVILWDTSQVAFHLYADDTPLTSESSSAELAKLAVKDCVRNIDAWMKANKLKMNKDKTELVVLNASHRQPSPLTSISVCDEVISNSSVATITRHKSWNTCVRFPFPNVNLGITVVSVLQNRRGSTLGKEISTFEWERMCEEWM